MTFRTQLEETWLDYPSPDGIAIAVVMTGCEHHCKGCHSPDLQKEEEYEETPEQLVNDIINYCKRCETNKIVIIGGDPLYLSNINRTKYVINRLCKDYDICLYTGYSIDYVKEVGLKGVKYFKCGVYDEKRSRESGKSDTEMILASPNQDFYDKDYNLISTNGILKF